MSIHPSEPSTAQLVADLTKTAVELGRRLAVAEPDWTSDDEIRGFLARELADPPDDDGA